MADGKVVIETDLNSDGIEQGLKKTEKSIKSQAATLAAEYRKQGMSASDAFKKAWSEIERGSASSSSAVKEHWRESSAEISAGAEKLRSMASTGLKATVTAISAVSAALSAAGGFAIKTGADFEAGMSEVKAISGASAEQIQALTEKAKEMGAKTKFSATESAAAFKYMAMAGWETGDMLDGIEGVMNLAAASGEDLASVSDIVTDALTAFGLQASDSAHFADVLAKASSSSNTNVGLMGATFKYVAPLAGAMGYSIEDTAVAIGLMANAGIKGEQAGTSLRAMFTRLADPPRDAAAAMDALGVSITNTDGTMKPLADVMGDLREKFSGLSEEQKIEYASSIAGQEAMSGLLAIVNAAPEDYEKLTAAIADSSGAAKEQAEIMQDNLKGAVEELGGGLETLGLAFYETISDDLKGAVEQGISYVDELVGAFEDGGLEGAVEKAGEVFGDMAAEAAKQAPKMVKSAVQFIKAFGKGISDNRKEIWDAAVEVAEVLADGLTDLLPRSVQKPVKEAVDTISKSLTSGGLKHAASTAVTLFKNVATAAGDVFGASLKTAAKLVDILADHADILIPILATGAAAFGAYKVIGTITPLIASFQTASLQLSLALMSETSATLAATGALTAKEVIVGIVTRKISLATAATMAWNAALNLLGGPIGLIMTAVGVLTVGLVAYNATQEKAVSETDEWVAKNDELIESISDTNESIQSNIEQRQKSYDGSVAEAGALDILTQRLFELSDKENKSTEDKAAMSAIVDELNEKIPNLGLAIDGETGYLNLNKEAILQVTQASRDMIMAKAAQESLVPIAQSIYEAEMNLAQATEKSAEAYEVYKTAQEKATTEGQRYVEMAEKGQISNAEAARKISELNQEVSDTKSVYDELSAEVDKCNQTLTDAQDKYTFMEGKVAEYSAAVNQAKVSVDEMGASEQLLSAVHSESSEQIQQALATVSEGFMTATNANREQLIQQVTDLENNAAMMTAALQAGMPGVTQEMVDQCNQMVFNAKAELDKLEPNFQESTNTANQQMIATTKGFMPLIFDAFKQNAKGAKDGYDSEDVTGHHQQSARDSSNALIQETAAHWKEEYAAASGSGSHINSGLDSQNVEEHFGDVGDNSGANLVNALYAHSGEANASGSDFGDSANAGVDSSGMESHFRVTANLAVYEFIRAISAMVDASRTAGQRIGDNSISGLKSGSAGSYGLGADFASGYANGIWGGIGAAVSAAASMAAQAIAAVKRAQASASPSKKTRKLAHDFDDGYSYGILDKKDEVEDAAEEVSEAAIGALDFTGVDVSGLASKMRQAVAAENYALGTSMSSEFVNKIYKNVEVENKQEAINYEKMASYIVAAFIRAGIRVGVDERDFGRLIGEIIGT